MFKKIGFMLLSMSLFFMLASCGNTTDTTTVVISTTTVATEQQYQLPDLSGLNKVEIITALDNLGLNYSLEYETNTDYTKDTFIRYGNDDLAGDMVNADHDILVILATDRLVLPDLTGMGTTEISLALLAKNILFTYDIVTDNTVPDQTFVGYSDGLEAGDLIPTTFTITVIIGYNSPTLPDLSGMQKEEIADVLSAANIAYTFDYVVDDNYPEDEFAGYADFEIGDFYLEGTVTIDLYKNTFTDNSTSLIISKYVDGGDDTDDQAIEIYNATDSSINLGDYYLAIYRNGSYTMTYQIDFESVQLGVGETYVVVNSAANTELLAYADQVSTDLVYDGNDTIQICYSNGTYIDTIYNLGDRNYIMDNEVYIRDASVVKGTREYSYNEWHGFIPTYIGVLGTHPITIEYEIPFEFIDRAFDDPAGGMDSVALSGIADGDTAYFSPGFLGAERVRFLGVDTPETYPIVDPWGPEAKEYTTLILNNAIGYYIQSDPDVGTTDNYGRHLGLVWANMGEEGFTVEIKNSSDEVVRTEVLTGWILLNYHLVLNGYSYNYYGEDSTLVMNNRYLYNYFQEAEKFARDNNLGIHE